MIEFKKKIILIGLILLMANTTLAHYAQDSYNLPGNKERQFKRGITNILTGPLEVPANMMQVDRHQIVPPWLTGGIKGSVLAVTRCLVGVYEVLTVPFTKAPNDPIMVPEYVWERPHRTVDINEQHRILDPEYKEATFKL